MKIIITIIIGVILLGAYLTYDHAMYVKHKSEISDSIEQVASEIISTNFTSVVHIGGATKSAITTAKNYKLKWGDEPSPIGDGKADLRIIITKESGVRIGLRMKYDSAIKKYHILGYWTLSKSEQLHRR